jgi:hypothetical protein
MCHKKTMKIDELKPGRELDALVAEKVMGLLVIEPLRLYYRHPTVTDEIPEYSTEIAAAWEVVEKIKTQVKAETDSRDFTIMYVDNKWLVGWALEYDGGMDKLVSADTAPHAICLAALKVVSSQSPD